MKEVAVAVADLAMDAGEDYEKLCDRLESFVRKGLSYGKAFERLVKEVRRCSINH